jgi:hypothetical protein
LNISKRTKNHFVFFSVLLIILISIVADIEPLYTIHNSDKYSHNATIEIIGYEGEQLMYAFYQLEPGQTVQLNKIDTLIIKWSNPHKEGKLNYAPGISEYVTKSEGLTHYVSQNADVPHHVYFELVNESGEFELAYRPFQ